MHKIFLLLFILKNVMTDEEESNEKYIDLLPEEEKQEFLNRIARRILEGVKSNDTPNESHADITDDQLDAHNSYVQEIIKEESENFKSEKGRRFSENNEEAEKDKRHDLNNGNKDEHIDLTLREGKRQKRKNSDHDTENEPTTELSYDAIPVQTVYDQVEINDDLKNANESVNTNRLLNNNTVPTPDNEGNTTNDVKETVTAESITEATSTLSDDSFNDLTNKTIRAESLRKSYHHYNLGTTIITGFEPDSNENSPTTEDYDVNGNNITLTPETKEIINNTTSDESTWGSTQKIYVEDSSNEKGDLYINETTKVHDNISDTDILHTESISVTISSIDIDDIKINESAIIKNKTNSNNNFQGMSLRSKTNSDEHLYKDGQTEKTFTEIVTLRENFSSMKTASPSVPISVHITDNYIKPVNKDFNLTENFSAKNENISTSITPKDFETLATEKNLAQQKQDDNITLLRTKLDDLDDTEIVNHASQHLDTHSGDVTAYEVYEIDADKPHFLPAGKINLNEHPYYIPVYNYAPDNAYFKPYNKFGLNKEDFKPNSPASEMFEDLNHNIQIHLPNGRSRFSGYSNKGKSKLDARHHKNKKHSYKKQKAKLLEFVKPVSHKLINHNIYYNPYDYPDMDYNLGSILRRGKKYEDYNDKYFPNSNEPDHPISSIHKSDTVKDHIRAVRKIFYLQKLFGYVSDVNDSVFRKANQYFKIDKTSKKPKEDSIAMDYYFGRADSHDQGPHNRAFRVNKSKSEYMNPTIVPLTPNPLNIDENIYLENIPTKKPIDHKLSGMEFKKIFESMITVLKDTIRFNNEDLVKYDWLKTAVNIQAAIRKLMDLIEHLQFGEYVHPKDTELMKYVLYLFKSSKISFEDEIKNSKLNNIDAEAQRGKGIKYKNHIKHKKVVLPKTKRENKMKKPLKLWKELSTFIRSKDKVESKERKLKVLYDFEDLLQGLLFYLNDFHDAIKHIAMITKFNKQTWFQDLKDIYLKKANRKRLAQVILHLSLCRLLDHVEESAKNGVEDGFRIFVMNNREVVNRSKEESLFVLIVLEELRRMNISR